ncbi:MAG TPA: pitrilysin family protein [Caulobacteraceae bacterium]|jgi:zinc protease|nr:pitrilysin family protein [Caulobacteraceae bacterium]
MRLAPVVACAALLLSGLAVSAAAQPAPVTVAPVHYDYRVLPNGLKVYAVHDTRSPNVAVQVWYQVGSKDDPVGRSGFAHLFEHMMFKATRDMPAEYFDRITEDVGGANNASTNDDYTEYHEVVPANYLKTILWAEAERMGSLVVDEANFKSERDVVKEELRQRIFAQPYGRLFGLDLAEASFDVSPYGRPGIGSIENLDSSTLADVQAFHATYYRPDNAVLVVVGDFDPAQLNAWIDQYFGPIVRPAGAIPRVTATEPMRTAPRTIADYEPNTPLPAVLMSYPFPAASSPDMPALIVLDAILSKGDSSRLNDDLVYKQQIAQEAFSFQELRQQPGAYAIGAVMAEGKTPQEGEHAILAELARLRNEPVSDAELRRAKNQLITDTLRQRETDEGQASELETAVVLYGDASKVNRLVSDVQAVTAADVQRVAQKYLGDNRRVTVDYQGDEHKPAGFTPPAPAATIQAQTLTRPADIRVVAAAPEAERIKPPAPGEPVAARPVETHEKVLANGMHVIVAPLHSVPLVTAEMTVDAGAATDPQRLPGVAEMASTLMTKGTTSRSAEEIARQIESLGGELGVGASYDGSQLSLVVKRDELDPAMTVFADVARNPVFASEELDRARQQTLAGIQVAMGNPSQLGAMVADRAVYGAAPYGEPSSGTQASVSKFTHDDVARFHAQWWRPDEATLVLAGDVTPEQGFALAEHLFGDWKPASGAKPAAPAPVGATPPPRIVVVDLPHAGQAAVIVSRVAISRDDPRFYPALVAATVLGGGYSGRLNEEIRIKRGLSYGASGRIDFRRAPGPFIASTSTKNESAVQVVDLIVNEMKKLGTTAPGDAELAARKASIVGGFDRTVETTEDTANLLSRFTLYNVNLDEIGRYADHVKAVTPQQVQAIGAELFDPAQAQIVVVGDASVFLKALKAEHPGVEVIPAADVDLNNASLRKGGS